MPPVKRASLRYSHAWIAFAQWTPPFTPGSKWRRRGQPGTGSCPRSLSERKTSSRRGACLLNTARQSTKDESALPTPRLFARCANAERYCWERRIVLPSPGSRQPPQRATPGMVPVALGTQTLGSVLRAASYCGVTGFKASYGLLPMEGVLPMAKSLDTLGFFTHTPADMLALWESLGHPAGRTEDLALGAPEPMPEAQPAMAAAFQNALSLLRSAGASIRSIDIAGMLAKLNDASSTVMFYEGARFHQERYNEFGARLLDLADLV